MIQLLILLCIVILVRELPGARDSEFVGASKEVYQNENLACELEIYEFGKLDSEARFYNIPPIVSENYIYFVNNNNEIICFDYANKKEKWMATLDDSIYSNKRGEVTLYKDQVFVVCGDTITAFNQEGDILWKKKLLTPSLGAAVVYENDLFVLTENDELLAFDRQTGASTWMHFSTNIVNESPDMGIMGPVASPQTLVAHYQSGELYAFNPITKKVIWIKKYNNFPSHRYYGLGLPKPYIYQNQLFVFDGTDLNALNLDDGSLIWAIKATGYQSPIAFGDKLFQINNQKNLRCLNRFTGHVIWETSFEDLVYGPCVSDGHLYVVGYNIHKIHIDTGAILNTLPLEDFCITPPVSTQEGKIIFVLSSGEIVKYSERNLLA